MTTKRIKDGLLTSLILLTLLCAAASFASFSGGTGAADGPLVIETSADLRALAVQVNSGDSCSGKVIILSNDIDLGGSANQWTPIGTEANPFFGTFDGNGHRISGLYINAASNDMQGLFGYVSGDAAEIRSLTVSGDVTGGYEVGIIAGHIRRGMITNCVASGTVAGTQTGNSNAGGIAGRNYAGTISNCVSVCGTVSGAGHCVGGIVGTNGGPSGTVSTIENCTAICNVVRGNDYVGGIAGQSDRGSITNCASTCGTVFGTVSGTDDKVGGIVGYKHGGCTVSNCGWQKDDAHGVGAVKHLNAVSGASFDVISYDVRSADMVAVTCLPDKYSLTLTNGTSAEVALTTYPHNNPGNIKSDPAPAVSPDIAAASYSGGKISVSGTAPGTGCITSITFRPTHFSGNLEGYSADVTLNPQIALTVTAVPTPPTPPTPPAPAGGSSGGCSAGFAALALLAVVPVIARRKKRS